MNLIAIAKRVAHRILSWTHATDEEREVLKLMHGLAAVMRREGVDDLRIQGNSIFYTEGLEYEIRLEFDKMRHSIGVAVYVGGHKIDVNIHDWSMLDTDYKQKWDEVKNEVMSVQETV